MKTNIELAREAGFSLYDDYAESMKAGLDRFAYLVRADQRERDAKVCEVPTELEDWEILGGAEGRDLCNGLAAAIRAGDT